MKGLKTGGRQKGSKNHTSAEIREVLIDILYSNLPRLRSAIAKMKDEEAAKLLLILGKHLTYPEVSPERFSEEQLQQVIDYLKKQQNE